MNRRCWGRSTVLGWMRGHVPHVLLGTGADTVLSGRFERAQ